MTPTLLENAISSIRVGVEDSETGTPARILSAIRNLHAGILLLYKQKLVDLSPPDSNRVLLMARSIPVRDKSGKLIFKGTGKRTADTQQIKERLTQLGVAVDWDRVERLAAIRNDIEHHFSVAPITEMTEAIAASFLLIRDFLSAHLGHDPASALGPECWSVLLSVSEVFEREKLECRDSLAQVRFSNATIEGMADDFHCPECGSPLIAATDDDGEDSETAQLLCKACGAMPAIAEVVEYALQHIYEWNNYVAMTDGGEPALVTCPECGRESFVVEDGACALCELVYENEKCNMCGAALSVDDYGNDGLCSYCAHIVAKND